MTDRPANRPTNGRTETLSQGSYTYNKQAMAQEKCGNENFWNTQYPHTHYIYRTQPYYYWQASQCQCVCVCVLRVYLRHSLDALLIYVCISTSFSYCEMLSNHFLPGKSIYRFVVVGSISIQTLSVRPLSVPIPPRSFC